MTEQEFKDRNDAELQRLNREHGVIEDINELKGWHLAECAIYKPGVYRGHISRWLNGGAEFKQFYARQDMIRLAVELKYLSKPNGYTLP